MTDLSLEDLAGGGDAGGAAEAAAEAAEETAESGESLLDLFEFMDERGYLQPLMFGTNGGDDGGEPAPVQTTDGGDVTLTASSVAALARRVEEEVGDVPISKVAAFAERQPDRVNAVIAELDDVE
jgi:hypothetical protein